MYACVCVGECVCVCVWVAVCMREFMRGNAGVRVCACVTSCACVYLRSCVKGFCSSHMLISHSGCHAPPRVWHDTTKPIPPPLCAPDGDMVYKGKNLHYKYHFVYIYNIIKPNGLSPQPLRATAKKISSSKNTTLTNACGKPPTPRSW